MTDPSSKSEGVAAENPVSKRAKDGLEFSLSHNAAMAAFVGMSVAFQTLLEASVFPERVRIDRNTPAGHLKSLAARVLRETKNIPYQGLSETDEAEGIGAAIGIIKDAVAGLEKQV